MIARRLSLVKDSDFIAVMEGGQCVEMGTHDELISTHGLYSDLVRCEEVVKLPKRLRSRNHNGTEFKAENDLGNKASAVERVDSLEMKPNADYKDPMSLDFASNLDSGYTPKCKDISCCSKQVSDLHQLKEKYSKCQSLPSLGRLVKLSLPEWLYAILGSLGASILGSFRPILAYVVGLIVTAYYKADGSRNIQFDVNKWCLISACMAIVILVSTVLQHFYFGIMGEIMTEKVRRMMFSGFLCCFCCYNYWVLSRMEVGAGGFGHHTISYNLCSCTGKLEQEFSVTRSYIKGRSRQSQHNYGVKTPSEKLLEALLSIMPKKNWMGESRKGSLGFEATSRGSIGQELDP